MSDVLLAVVFVLAAAVSLATSRLLVSRLERIGARIELSEHSVASAAVADLHAQVQQLLGELGQLRGRLRDSEEELDAARRLNRTLMRERNSGATEPAS